MPYREMTFVERLVRFFGWIAGYPKTPWVETPKLVFTELTFSSGDSINLTSNHTNFLAGVDIMTELREGQEVKVTASLRTRTGNKASYQTGSAVWASTDESVASVTPIEGDELSAVVKGVNGSANSPATISVSLDGDPDTNVRAIVATMTVVVTQGEAYLMELEAGAPIDSETGMAPMEDAPFTSPYPVPPVAGESTDNGVVAGEVPAPIPAPAPAVEPTEAPAEAGSPASPDAGSATSGEAGAIDTTGNGTDSGVTEPAPEVGAGENTDGTEAPVAEGDETTSRKRR